MTTEQSGPPDAAATPTAPAFAAGARGRVGRQAAFFILLTAGVTVTYSLRSDTPAWNAYVFIALLLSWSLIRMSYAAKAADDVASSRVDGRERALLTGVFIGMLLLPIIALATPLLGFADVSLPGWMHVAGLIVGLAGLYLFWRAHADLDRNWSPTLELRVEHRLITTGVYARMRHPMYTAIFLITISQACLIDNLIAGPSGFVTFLLLYLLRVRAEETLMAEQFQAEWDDYALRTPRLIPHWSAAERAEP